jgi:hypothetical protein
MKRPDSHPERGWWISEASDFEHHPKTPAIRQCSDRFASLSHRLKFRTSRSPCQIGSVAIMEV